MLKALHGPSGLTALKQNSSPRCEGCGQRDSVLDSSHGVSGLKLTPSFLAADLRSINRAEAGRSHGRREFNRQRVRRRAAIEASADFLVDVEQKDPMAADFCGVDGVVLKRPMTLGQAGLGKRYHIHTFGCQMNLADSERMAGILEAMGYAATDEAQNADVLIYNTCSIRDKAEQKLYSVLGTQVARKHTEPGLRIVVAGCVAQQEGEALLRRVPELDLVLGPQQVNRLHHYLGQVELGSQVCATEQGYIEEDITVPKRDSRVTAWVNVIYGCNERCSYCVVPAVRGLEQSRTPDAIRQEMQALGDAGYKEVTLLGQNVDAYGRDLPGATHAHQDSRDGRRRRWTLADLLLHVHDAHQGIQRIRFATSHPRYFSERLVQVCAELPKVSKYFHIPFQSGDDKVLKDMSRGYTAQKYKDIIACVRSYMPDAAITADAIVGFPGETEEQFQNTLRLMEDVKFDLVNTAAYSPRPNTPAALWDNQVAELAKMDRLQRINRLVLEHSLERNQRYLGRVERVLVEGRNQKPGRENQLMGRIDGNRLVFFEGGEHLIAELVDVEITHARSVSLTGKLAAKA